MRRGVVVVKQGVTRWPLQSSRHGFRRPFYGGSMYTPLGNAGRSPVDFSRENIAAQIRCVRPLSRLLRTALAFGTVGQCCGFPEFRGIADPLLPVASLHLSSSGAAADISFVSQEGVAG